MKISIAQLNPKIGAFDLIQAQIQSSVTHAIESGADLLVFPEAFVGGYPARDLWLHPDFKLGVEKTHSFVEALSQTYPNLGILIGSPMYDGPLTNSALLYHGGALSHRYNKQLLPAYDVFDDSRYFTPTPCQPIVEFKGKKLGLLICEDAWAAYLPITYGADPVETLALLNPDIVIHLSASPFEIQKHQLRQTVQKELTQRLSCPVITVNQVGLQDDIVFDGASMGANAKGDLIFQLDGFSELITTIDLTSGPIASYPSEIESIRKALVLSIRDYLQKTGFKKIVLGLSGGIDSAVTAALAVEALRSENVVGIMMPSLYSSEGSLIDAEQLAKNLGIQTHLMPITPMFEESLSQLCKGLGLSALAGLTTENLQSRIRGQLLMAYSNQTGALVLSTGNKSEMAMGYCTLYGDMNGALCVLGDVYKTKVYELATHLNRPKEVIPEASITKPPSAELRPDQTDQDSLPPYDTLDAILNLLIEGQKTSEDCVKAGFDETLVHRIKKQISINEHKRRQAALIPRITSKAFGSGRRIPILRV